MNGDFWLGFFLTLFLLLIIGWLISSCKEDIKFEKWANQHCKIIGYVKSVHEGERTGYQCDDGMQYWR